MKQNKEILVSVYMTTYNQEDYIAQALESVVTQECDFIFELIVGEDGSTDKTREIVESYYKKYPEIIKPIFRDKNVGAAQNSQEVMEACVGKYMAFCEGDDCWLSPFKLQKQVDVMQSSSKIKGVYSQVKYVDANNKALGLSDRSLGDLDYKTLLQTNPIHTVSFLIDRSVLTKSIQDIARRAPYSDFVIFLAASFYGEIFFIDEVLACYRKNVGTMHRWSNASGQVKRLEILNLFENDENFSGMKKYIRLAKRFHLYKLSMYTVKESKYTGAIKYYFMTLYFTIFVLCAKNSEVYQQVSFIQYLKLTIAVIPFSEVIYKKLKNYKNK